MKTRAMSRPELQLQFQRFPTSHFLRPQVPIGDYNTESFYTTLWFKPEFHSEMLAKAIDSKICGYIWRHRHFPIARFLWAEDSTKLPFHAMAPSASTCELEERSFALQDQQERLHILNQQPVLHLQHDAHTLRHYLRKWHFLDRS